MSAPYWPTFRGHPLTDPGRVAEEIGNLKGTVYVSVGQHSVHTTKNGGIGPGKPNSKFPVVSYERGIYIPPKTGGRKRRLYLIGWIGGYEKGRIPHLGWQFPHCEEFWTEELDLAAHKHYEDLARIMGVEQ